MNSNSMPRMRRLPNLTVGQTILFGGALVGATLGGFYMNLCRQQAKKVEDGTVPHYEHLMAHVGYSGADTTTPGGTPFLPVARVEARATALPAPQREHHSGHATIADYKLSPGYSDAGRREQPTPQRAGGDGTGVYTKSPDYVRSYEKTAKFRPGGEKAKDA